MSLRDDIRVGVRVTQTKSDPEIDALIDSALSKLRQCGIDESLLDPDMPDPRVKAAVMFYAKSRYGYDNRDSDTFEQYFEKELASLLNSRANVLLQGD